MRKLLFFALGRLSKGEVRAAADFARQLPRSGFRCGFLATGDAVSFLRDLGLSALPLDSPLPAENLATVDEIVRTFGPDHLVAADAMTLASSTEWSGLSRAVLRERYDVPLACFDQYDWAAAGHAADCYGGGRLDLPHLLDDWDLVIRCCPLHRPADSPPGVAVVGMTGGGLRDGGLRPRADDTQHTGDVPVVFLNNSPWEDTAPITTPAPDLARLRAAAPRILHSHLAALGRPLRVVHVGPRQWSFPIAEHLEYRHFSRMPHPLFHEHLTAADLYVTTNVASMTLIEAVLAGVPALVLDNHADLGTIPDWLAETAPELTEVRPFRVLPWGWYDLLTPILRDNPYTDCFAAAGFFDRAAVVGGLGTLLGDGAARTTLHERQIGYRDRLRALAPPVEAFPALVSP